MATVLITRHKVVSFMHSSTDVSTLRAIACKVPRFGTKVLSSRI